MSDTEEDPLLLSLNVEVKVTATQAGRTQVEEHSYGFTVPAASAHRGVKVKIPCHFTFDLELRALISCLHNC